MGNVKAYRAALDWYRDQGVDDVLEPDPVNRLVPSQSSQAPVSALPMPAVSVSVGVAPPPLSLPLLGASDARREAVRLAQQAQTLDDLRAAIAAFEGISLKKTAINLVFSDGNPRAPVMLVGEAPGADEDRLGKPFVGASGQLLDKMLAAIGLSRHTDNLGEAVYIANILNWRPPGNRTPSPGEIEVSLPFIERHIQLAAPKLLILCGGVSAKALLGREEGISRLRQTWYDYIPQTPELRDGAVSIPGAATFHPSYLLRTPAQKKAAWADLQMIQDKRRQLGLVA